MEKSLTIIIPIFNTPSIYLNDCLLSISNLNKEYDIEVLMIDDGSTIKETINVCKNFEIIENFKYFQLQNYGVSNARNFGISQSTKQFVMFVDSDDVINREGVDYFFTNECGFFDYYKFNFEIINKSNKIIRKYNLVDINNQIGDGVCWGKIFSTKIIKENNLLFDTNVRYGEDSLFLSEYKSLCLRKVFINKFIYKYRINSFNTSHRYNENVFEDFNKILLNVINEDNAPLIMVMFLGKYIFPIYVFHKDCNLKYKEKKKVILRYLNSNDFVYKQLINKIDDLKNINLYWKIYIFLLQNKMYKTMVFYDKIITKIFKKYI